MYLSPCVEEPLNSKVIKSVLPDLRSRKCLSWFEIPMFNIYMYISNIRIWRWYITVLPIIFVEIFWRVGGHIAALSLLWANKILAYIFLMQAS